MSSISTINEIVVVIPIPGTKVSNCIGSLKISLHDNVRIVWVCCKSISRRLTNCTICKANVSRPYSAVSRTSRSHAKKGLDQLFVERKSDFIRFFSFVVSFTIEFSSLSKNAFPRLPHTGYKYPLVFPNVIP